MVGEGTLTFWCGPIRKGVVLPALFVAHGEVLDDHGLRTLDGLHDLVVVDSIAQALQVQQTAILHLPGLRDLRHAGFLAHDQDVRLAAHCPRHAAAKALDHGRDPILADALT